MLLLALLAAALIFQESASLPLSPANGSIIYERTPTFTWLGSPNEMLIDDNPAFTSPIRVTLDRRTSHTLTEPLPLGTYYWKVDDSVVRTFELAGKASLDVEHTERGTVLKNTGNVDLLVDAGLDAITGNIIVPRETNRLLPGQQPEAVEGRADE